MSCVFLRQEKYRNYQNLTLLNLENDIVSIIIVKVKTVRVPLWVVHCHLCMESIKTTLPVPLNTFKQKDMFAGVGLERRIWTLGWLDHFLTRAREKSEFRSCLNIKSKHVFLFLFVKWFVRFFVVSNVTPRKGYGRLKLKNVTTKKHRILEILKFHRCLQKTSRHY